MNSLSCKKSSNGSQADALLNSDRMDAVDGYIFGSAVMTDQEVPLLLPPSFERTVNEVTSPLSLQFQPDFRQVRWTL